MGLTRPTAAQINTVVTDITDPIVLLNKGATLANIDVGFLINRDGGASSNVAVIWNETADNFQFVYTSSTGTTNANIAVTGYANLVVSAITANTTTINNTTPSTSASSGALVVAGGVGVAGAINSTGNITTNGYLFGNGSQLTGVITSVTKIISGTSNVTAYEGGNITVYVDGSEKAAFTTANIHITGSVIPTANLTYDLGSPSRRWRDAYFSGSTIYLGNAILSSSGDDIVISTTGGFGVPVGTTAQRTVTLGAIRYNTTLSKFEAYDGVTWNSLAYGTVSDFPSGDWGTVTTVTNDAFGISLATTFDCNSEGSLTYVDFEALT